MRGLLMMVICWVGVWRVWDLVVKVLSVLVIWVEVRVVMVGVVRVIVLVMMLWKEIILVVVKWVYEGWKGVGLSGWMWVDCWMKSCDEWWRRCLDEFGGWEGFL